MKKLPAVPYSKPTGFAKFGPGGPTVEEAKAAAIDAQEAAKTTRLGEKVPSWVQGAPTSAPVTATAQRTPAVGSVQLVPGQPARVVQRPAPAQSPAPQAAPVETQRERYEGQDYDIEIFRDSDGTWVAEIQYRLDENGQAGVERFSATSRDGLTMKMAQGKAAATRKIRQQNRHLKEGVRTDDWKMFWTFANLTEQQAAGLSESVRKTVVDATQVTQIQEFWRTTPESTRSKEEYLALEAFLKKSGGLPITVRNLQFALRELIAERQLPSALDLAQVRNDAPPVSAAPTVQPIPAARPAPPTPPVETSDAAIPQVPRKRGGTSGLVPGRSSSVSGLESTTATSATAEDERARATRLASTPEGMKQLRREAIPSLNPNRAGRR